MADTFDMLRSYTPQELNQIQQILAQRYQNAALQNQNMNTVASMTKNLSPAANLGIALGTLGGKWAAQRYNDIFDKNIYNQRKLNERLNDVSATFKYGPKFYGAGLPNGGVYAIELPAYGFKGWRPDFGLTGEGWENWQKQHPTAPATSTLID